MRSQRGDRPFWQFLLLSSFEGYTYTSNLSHSFSGTTTFDPLSIVREPRAFYQVCHGKRQPVSHYRATARPDPPRAQANGSASRKSQTRTRVPSDDGHSCQLALKGLVPNQHTVKKGFELTFSSLPIDKLTSREAHRGPLTSMLSTMRLLTKAFLDTNLGGLLWPGFTFNSS